MSSFIPAVRFACAIILAALCPAATAATFTVTTSTESGAGSLRQAILDANANGDATTDTIVFSIPGTAPITIQPLSALPYVLGRTVIDGTTQPGYNPGTGVPAIELDGSLQPYNTGNGLELGGSAGSNVVKALTINRFTGQAGFVYGYGVHVTGHGCLIQGCFVGTNSAAQPMPGTSLVDPHQLAVLHPDRRAECRRWQSDLRQWPLWRGEHGLHQRGDDHPGEQDRNRHLGHNRRG